MVCRSFEFVVLISKLRVYLALTARGSTEDPALAGTLSKRSTLLKEMTLSPAESPGIQGMGERCLIVERSLVSKRGHHHTQIAALASLLKGCQLFLLVGPSYDFFLPYPVKVMASDIARVEYLTRRIGHGSFRQKLIARADLYLSRRTFKLPRSGYGEDLAGAIRGFGLGPSDLVVIPSASLDSLAAAADAADRLGHHQMPRMQMRFLEPSLDEPRQELRETRAAGLLKNLPPRTALACETEELACWFSELFGYPFGGGAYLPCTIDPRAPEAPAVLRQPSEFFRVGVFGAPKRRKGSDRVSNIVAALRERDARVEIVVQGEAGDFERSGVFATAMEQSNERVRVVPLVGAMDMEAFTTALLSVNAVLLPYDITAYGLQGSGLVQDAVAALIPIVHSRGFSMRELLQNGNAIDAVTDADFADAIIKLAHSFNFYAEGCLKAREIFRRRLEHHVLFQATGREGSPPLSPG